MKEVIKIKNLPVQGRTKIPKVYITYTIMDKEFYSVFGIRFNQGYKKFNVPSFKSNGLGYVIPPEPEPEYFEYKRLGFGDPTAKTRDVSDLFDMKDEIERLEYGPKVDIQPGRLLSLLTKSFEYSEKIAETDANGNIVMDNNGNPVMLDGKRMTTTLFDSFKSLNDSLESIMRQSMSDNLTNNILNLVKVNNQLKTVYESNTQNFYTMDLKQLHGLINDTIGKLSTINQQRIGADKQGLQILKAKRDSALQAVAISIAKILDPNKLPTDEEIRRQVIAEGIDPLDRENEIKKRISNRNRLQNDLKKIVKQQLSNGDDDDVVRPPTVLPLNFVGAVEHVKGTPESIINLYSKILHENKLDDDDLEDEKKQPITVDRIVRTSIPLEVTLQKFSKFDNPAVTFIGWPYTKVKKEYPDAESQKAVYYRLYLIGSNKKLNENDQDSLKTWYANKDIRRNVLNFNRLFIDLSNTRKIIVFDDNKLVLKDKIQTKTMLGNPPVPPIAT